MMKKLLSLCMAVVLVIGLVGIAPETRAASSMKASEDCIAFIKAFEGFSGTPYRDSDGKFTIGYGTRCPDELVDQYMTTPMTQEEADAELREKLVTYETSVNQFIDRHGLDYKQHQYDALISLVFNCGSSWLTKGTTLVKALTGGAEGSDLIYAFSIYSMSGGTRSLGHVRRRLAEANIFLNGEYNRNVPDTFAYVLYNPQGGQIHANGGSYNVQGYEAAQTTAPIATASREGYVFKGWYTAASGGTMVTVLDMTTKNATLYAHWELDDGTSDSPESTDPSEPSDPVEPTDPTVPEENPVEPITVTVTGSVVNIRSGAGLNYDVVGSAIRGDVLVVTEMKEADDYLWGKVEAGWIALKHTDYTAPEESSPTDPSDSTNPTEDSSCNHEYIISEQIDSKCETGGSTTYTCTGCGDVYTDFFSAKGHDYTNATCTNPKTCKNCGKTQGDALGHSYSEPSCIKSQVCQVCGHTSGEALGHDFAPATCTSPLTCKVCGVTSGNPLSHKYSEATCTTPKTCTRCGQTSGQALGHNYTPATCTTAETCKICGETNGAAKGHSFESAACTKPQTCKTCGYETGAPLGHSYAPATCNKPQTCIDCGKTKGEPLGHSYEAATCTKPQTCKSCGETTGQMVAHDYTPATCTTAQTCKVCGHETGVPAAHNYGAEGYCTCGAKDPEFDEKYVIKTYATVVKTESLNVRVTPDGAVCGSLKLGRKVEILEQQMVGDRLWGRYSGGWICMRSYAKLETVTELRPVVDPTPPAVPEVVVKTFGTVIKTDTLNVRKTPDGAVIGTLYRGDRVEILEQKMVAGRMWGYTGSGWICLRSYVQLETVTESAGTPNVPENPVIPPEEKPQDPVTVEKTYATVINTNSLNVRMEPDGQIVTKLYRGDKVEILEQKMVNGRLWGLCEQGWICMRSYVRLETVTETLGAENPPETQQPEQNPEQTVIKTYATVILTDTLNIRVTPDGTVCGSLKLGERVLVLEQKFVSGRLWGRIEQGWICMRSYVKLETVNEAVENDPSAAEVGMITASCLNIRAEARANSAVVGYLFKGDTVVILEKVTVNGATWARIEQGWINMAYVA